MNVPHEDQEERDKREFQQWFMESVAEAMKIPVPDPDDPRLALAKVLPGQDYVGWRAAVTRLN